MSRKAMVIWIAFSLAACALSYYVGRHTLLAETSQSSEDFQRAWFEGQDKVNNEQAEKYRVEVAEKQERARQLYEQIIAEGVIAYHLRTDPYFVETRNRLTTDEGRAMFDQSFEADWRKRNAPLP